MHADCWERKFATLCLQATASHYFIHWFDATKFCEQPDNVIFNRDTSLLDRGWEPRNKCIFQILQDCFAFKLSKVVFRKRVVRKRSSSYRTTATTTFQLTLYCEMKTQCISCDYIYNLHTFFLSTQYIFVEPSKCLGERRIFPEFPETCRKSFGEFCLQIFSHNDHENIFFSFANIGRHLLKANNVGRHFPRIFKDFVQIFKDFAQIFRDFARIFDKSNFWGCACTPCTPASYTTDSTRWILQLCTRISLAIRCLRGERIILFFCSTSDAIATAFPQVSPFKLMVFRLRPHSIPWDAKMKAGVFKCLHPE